MATMHRLLRRERNIHQYYMEPIQREQHAAYMRDLRQSRDYKDRENKLRVLGRIQEGSVPHVYSLTKYSITRDDINDL